MTIFLIKNDNKSIVIPEGSPRYNDLVDVIIQSVTKNVDLEQKDGSITKEQIIDGEGLWWKTNKIASNMFGAFAFEEKEFERMGDECFNNMSYPRAIQYQKQILAIGQSLRSSMDAKSSESRLDKHNARQTMVDTIGRNRVEKIYSLKGDVKRSLGDTLTGRKVSDDIEDDG